MKYVLRKVPVRALPSLILVAILTAVLLFPVLKYSETHAQAGLSSAISDTPSLSVDSASASAIELSWGAVSGAVSYDLRAWWAGADGWQRLDDGSLTERSFTYSDVSAGTKYYYIVAGVDDAGRRGPWSIQVEVTVPDADAPTSTPTSTPTLSPESTLTPTPTLTVTATPTSAAPALPAPTLQAEAGTGQVTLTWGAVANAVGYRLIVWDWAISDWQFIGGVLTGLSYTYGELEAGTTFYFHVQAVAASGAASPWSALASAAPSASGASTSTNTPTPTGTKLVTATPTLTPTAAALSAPVLMAQDGAEEVYLTWNAVGGAESYRLIVWDGETNDWRSIGGVLTGTNYVHRELTAGRTYYFHVRAVGAFGAGSVWSGQASATAKALGALTSTPTRTITPTPEFTPTVATTQREALIALYEATDGENWTNNKNWLTDAPLDSWYGVTADRLGRVSRLQLVYNGLHGKIPNLSSLVDLRFLSLSSNSISNPFPDLSSLPSLTHLSFNNTDFTGPIPDFSTYTSLRFLSLGLNGFEGPVPDEDSLPNLISLNLQKNRLTGTIPPGLANLLDLNNLSLSGNLLIGCIPAALKFLKHNDLDELGLPYCDLPTPTPGPTPTPATTEKGALVALYEATGGSNWPNKHNWLTNEPISVWYGVSTDSGGRVTRLDLRSNNLTGAIPDLRALAHLESLRLAGNNLTGPVPSFEGLSNLSVLDLGNNELDGTVPELGALTNLSFLSLYGNRLTGKVPDLSGVEKLSWLNLGANSLSGTVPDLSKLTGLTRLFLADNELTGEIPDLKALTELREVFLTDNQFTGSIPDLSELTKLETLAMASNQMSGQIPDLSELTELRVLSLSNNQLTGSIPNLSSLTDLKIVNLGSNQLSGPIPDLSALRDIESLVLANNQLSGQIPDLSLLVKLVSLDLGNNQLSGPIPDLSLLTKLRSLDLSHNKLTGTISFLQLLPSLSSVRLQFNELTGPISDLRSLTELAVLRLAGNPLCLPAGQSFSHPNSRLFHDLDSLNPRTCTDSDLASIVRVPQNLETEVSASHVTLTWDAVSNADGYQLRTWNSFDQQWSSIGGELTGTSYTYAVETDGRNFLYQIRAQGANGIQSGWSKPVYAIVVPTQFPPPPLSLGYSLNFQRHFEVGGVYVIAPSQVTDERLVLARGIITGMLVNRSELLDSMAYYSTTIYIDDDARPLAFRIEGRDEEIWGANVPETETYCSTFLHEFSHLVNYALEDQADGEEFIAKLQALYDSALTAGLWNNRYASTNSREYWAEIVKFWFEESVVATQGSTQLRVEDYDPEAAKLVEEVFGDATVPAECKP